MVIGFGGDDTISTGFGDDFVYGGEGVDKIDAGDGNDSLYHNMKNDTDDHSADRLEGGGGYDKYFVGDGDTIKDTDGKGSVKFNGLTLSKGYSGDGSSGQGGGHEGGSDKIYRGTAGETYQLKNGKLTVEYNGAKLDIEDWSKDKNLSIELVDGKPPEGGSKSPSSLTSPLVLDLDGDGLELSALDSSVAFFDIDNDGVRERTGWVSSDDGLLVLDRNGNGTIDNGNELFGYGETIAGRGGLSSPAGPLAGPGDLEIRYQSGFAKLAALDLNNDHVIDAADFDFTQLRIWRDFNGDGVSQSEELFTLGDAGVASISLMSTAVSLTNAGNLITDASTFTTTDGTVRNVSDVWFQFNQYDTQYDTPEGMDPALEGLSNFVSSGMIGGVRTCRPFGRRDHAPKNRLQNRFVRPAFGGRALAAYAAEPPSSRSLRVSALRASIPDARRRA